MGFGLIQRETISYICIYMYICFDHDPRNATPDANSNVSEVKHFFFVIGLNMFRRGVSSSTY